MSRSINPDNKEGKFIIVYIITIKVIINNIPPIIHTMFFALDKLLGCFKIIYLVIYLKISVLAI